MSPVAAGFGRHQKLLKGAQFKAVFEQKISVHGRYFSLYVVRSAISHARLGLAVSKRVSKKAVERNRIKRQIRESFRANQLMLSSAGGSVDCVVVSRASGAEQPNRILKKDLDSLWNRANLKCESYQKNQ